MIRRVLFLVFNATLSAATPPATAGELPEALRGIMASPSCAAPEQAQVATGGAYLVIEADKSWLTTLDAGPVGPDGWVAVQPKDDSWYLARRTADGRLEEAYPPDNAPKGSLPGPRWNRASFEDCGASLPAGLALLHGEAAAFFRALDGVAADCQGGTPRCAPGLFALADVSGDGRLSRAEIARLLRIAAYLGPLMGDEAIEHEVLAAAVAAMVPLGPLLAAAVVGSFDYDDDGGISLGELLRDREVLAGGAMAAKLPAGADVNQALQQLKGLEGLLRSLAK